MNLVLIEIWVYFDPIFLSIYWAYCRENVPLARRSSERGKLCLFLRYFAEIFEFALQLKLYKNRFIYTLVIQTYIL